MASSSALATILANGTWKFIYAPPSHRFDGAGCLERPSWSIFKCEHGYWFLADGYWMQKGDTLPSTDGLPADISRSRLLRLNQKAACPTCIALLQREVGITPKENP